LQENNIENTTLVSKTPIYKTVEKIDRNTGETVNKDTDEIEDYSWGMDYISMIPILHACIKDMKNEIKSLKSEIAALKSNIKD
jgi:hypothetical protein